MPHCSLTHIKAILADPAPVTWVFAGDSITHGAFHTFGQRDYTELFSERVRWEMGRGRDCVIKTGVSGWRIGNIREDLEWSILRHAPKIVSLNVGMNDATARAAGVEIFTTTYRLVLDRLVESGAALILHAPNAISETLDPARDEVSLYADAVRGLARAYEAVLVDHETNWKVENTRPISYWLTDAIHPNAYGHRRMAQLLLRELEIFDPESVTGRLLVP